MVTATYPPPLVPGIVRPASRVRRATAREVSHGVWLIEIESKSEPGTMHELRVVYGEAGVCTCTAASFKLGCHHQADAAALASALDMYYAAEAAIRAEREAWSLESRQVIDRNKGEMAFADHLIRKLGYSLDVMEVQF